MFKKILGIQNNPNTHFKGTFYEYLSAGQAFQLAQRFEFFFTPTKASCRNMVEIEHSALTSFCLKIRVPDIETLTNQVNPIIKERNEQKIKVIRQFSDRIARDKLKRHYGSVNSNI